MFKQNLDLSLSTTTVAHDKGSYMCPLQFLPTQHSRVLSGPPVASVAPLCKLDSRRTNEEGEKKAVPQYRGYKSPSFGATQTGLDSQAWKLHASPSKTS